jgi:hypothetical protein
MSEDPVVAQPESFSLEKANGRTRLEAILSGRER